MHFSTPPKFYGGTLGPTTLKLPLQNPKPAFSIGTGKYCYELILHNHSSFSHTITNNLGHHQAYPVAGALLLPNQHANGKCSRVRAQASGLLRPCTPTAHTNAHTQRPRHHPVLSHQDLQGVDTAHIRECFNARQARKMELAQHCLGKWTVECFAASPASPASPTSPASPPCWSL